MDVQEKVQKLPKEAQDLISYWTAGNSQVCMVSPDAGTHILVTQTEHERYDVTAIVRIGGTWMASVDATDVAANAAFEAVARRVSQ